MNILRALYGLADEVAEFLAWRGDWNRTWSPVSYWLAVATLVGLVLTGVVYSHEIWVYVRAAIR